MEYHHWPLRNINFRYVIITLFNSGWNEVETSHLYVTKAKRFSFPFEKKNTREMKTALINFELWREKIYSGARETSSLG